MVGLVHWYCLSSFVMESGSANPRIRLAQMKCEYNWDYDWKNCFPIMYLDEKEVKRKTKYMLAAYNCLEVA